MVLSKNKKWVIESQTINMEIQKRKKTLQGFFERQTENGLHDDFHMGFGPTIENCFFWCLCVCTAPFQIMTKAPKHEHTRRLEMSNVPLFFPPLVFHRCVTTPFFLASFVPVLSPFQWRWRGWGSGASNVTAGESLSWVEGSVYRVNQSCTNPWLPLTFTGGPFPINLQGPPPLEAWLRFPPRQTG